jgi:hypothetical protein
MELRGGSPRDASVFHLSFPDHMHHFDAGQDDAGATKILEAQHRSGDAFDGPMVLLDHVIQVLT